MPKYNRKPATYNLEQKVRDKLTLLKRTTHRSKSRIVEIILSQNIDRYIEDPGTFL